MSYDVTKSKTQLKKKKTNVMMMIEWNIEMI